MSCIKMFTIKMSSKKCQLLLVLEKVCLIKFFTWLFCNSCLKLSSLSFFKVFTLFRDQTISARPQKVKKAIIIFIKKMYLSKQSHQQRHWISGLHNGQPANQSLRQIQIHRVLSNDILSTLWLHFFIWKSSWIPYKSDALAHTQLSASGCWEYSAKLFDALHDSRKSDRKFCASWVFE